MDPSATIYCDMDGVLVDFFAGAKRVFARYSEDRVPTLWLKRSRTIPPAIHELNARFGRRYKLHTRDQLEITPVRQFVLSAISFGAGDFFATLPPLRDGVEELWPYLHRSGRRVALLSAPITNRRGVAGPSAAEGKRSWAARWLDPAPAEIVIRPSKYKQGVALRGGVANLLIDDRASTIERWSAAGGVGVLHQPGRSSETIAQLRALGL